jgi:hypothetical protein
MFEYEKFFSRLALALTFGLAWFLIKTLLYTLPKILVRAVTKNH